MRLYYLFYLIFMQFVCLKTQSDLFKYYESQKALFCMRLHHDYSCMDEWFSKIENLRFEFDFSSFDYFNTKFICTNDLKELFEFYEKIPLDLLIQLKSDSERFTEDQKLLAISSIKTFLLCHITTIDDDILKDNYICLDLFILCFKISQYFQKNMEKLYYSLMKSDHNSFLENIVKDIIAFGLKEKKNSICIAQESMTLITSENKKNVINICTTKNREYFPLLTISCSFDKSSYDYNQFKFLMAYSLVYHDKEFSFFITGRVRLDDFGSFSISIGEFFKNKLCVIYVIDYHLFLNFYISLSSRNFQSYFVGLTYLFKSSFFNIDCGGGYSI